VCFRYVDERNFLIVLDIAIFYFSYLATSNFLKNIPAYVLCCFVIFECVDTFVIFRNFVAYDFYLVICDFLFIPLPVSSLYTHLIINL